MEKTDEKMDEKMDMEKLLSLPAYGVGKKQKSELYAELLTDLTRYHGRKCPEYGRFLSAFTAPGGNFFRREKSWGKSLENSREEDIPFFPVSVFKEKELRSIPEEDIFKVLTSSGTSGQRPSRIALDARTSGLQQRVLARIVAEEIGEKRIPCLILDTKSVLRDREHFSARGAGILGFSMFASRVCYALDENMNLNLEEIQDFIRKYRSGPKAEPGQRFLLYGFTYVIWQYFVRALEEAGVTLDLEGSVLIHGGGWKKMEAQKVSPEIFAERVRAVTGITTVRSYYGMAEQTGCICMECKCGHLHVSTWSDIIVRREKDYGVCGIGEPGVLQVLTPIAMSYPGHSLLTEDRGVLLGEDDCPCGRKGKYFRVQGRLPRAEIRGCSDTLSVDVPSPFDRPEMPAPAELTLPDGAVLLAGTKHPVSTPMEPFASEILDFLDAFSKRLRTNAAVRTDPEVMALAFWCRRAHLVSLQKKHADRYLRLGRGRIFHLAPANVPFMWFYSYAIGLLAGNSGIVRLSEKTSRSESVQAVLKLLRTMFDEDPGEENSRKGNPDVNRSEKTGGAAAKSRVSGEFPAIRDRSCFITYGHSGAQGDAVTEKILKGCSGRVLWGGDETIRRMRHIPMPAHAVDIAFPDRVSIAVLDEAALESMEEETLKNLVHRFYNDTYIMDQKGCSSPQTVIWIRNNAGALDGNGIDSSPENSPEKEEQEKPIPPIREKWWRLLAREVVENQYIDGFRAARKLESAALAGMRKMQEEEPFAGTEMSMRAGFERDTQREGAPGVSSAVSSIRRYEGNSLYAATLRRMPEDFSLWRGGFGLFFETEADRPEEVLDHLSERVQTIVCAGISPQRLAQAAWRRHSAGVLRFVEPGEALQMDTVWDGMDLIAELSVIVGTKEEPQELFVPDPNSKDSGALLQI